MSNPTEIQLITNEEPALAPDHLLVGPKGAVFADTIKLRHSADIDLARGTLIMSAVMDSENVFIPATEAALTASPVPTFAILADDAKVETATHVPTAAYFEGDFNENAVIFNWETLPADHPTIVEAAREPLRRQKIFLRPVQK
jgi:hypothetical protein